MGEAFLADGLRKTSHRGEEPTFTAPRTAEGGCGGGELDCWGSEFDNSASDLECSSWENPSPAFS